MWAESEGLDAKTSIYLVRPLGFEPRTCGLRVRCSAIELEALGLNDHTTSRCDHCSGVTEGARTPDLQSHNLALYQLSYDHHRG